MSAPYLSAASDWLKATVVGKVALHEAQSVVTMEPGQRTVDVTISDGAKVRADHVILATGYRVDIDKPSMIHPALRPEIAADRAVPILNPWFESTVPGLYFIGFTSLRAFGPLFRFVGGCGAAARRVASAVARRR